MTIWRLRTFQYLRAVALPHCSFIIDIHTTRFSDGPNFLTSDLWQDNRGHGDFHVVHKHRFKE